MERGATKLLKSPRVILGGLLGGIVHVGIAVFLWNLFGFDNLWALLAIKPLTGGYIVLGMFVLGFVPAILYAGQNVIWPAVMVAGFLTLSGFGSWRATTDGAPVGGPTPFGVYILLWTGIVILVGLIGRFEYHRKQGTSG